jgi:hypothetical protein
MRGEMEMKVTKVTRKYFVLEDEKIYFSDPLDHDLTIKEMQKLWDDANAYISNLIARGRTTSGRDRNVAAKTATSITP